MDAKRPNLFDVANWENVFEVFIWLLYSGQLAHSKRSFYYFPLEIKYEDSRNHLAHNKDRARTKKPKLILFAHRSSINNHDSFDNIKYDYIF